MSDDDLPDRDASLNGDRSGEPLDAVDEAVLRRLGELFDGADGPPEAFHRAHALRGRRPRTGR